MTHRRLSDITTPTVHTGFLGEGHMAAAIIDGSRFSYTDPFFLLMDDRLDLPGGPPAGGPHPHAGFETLTFVVEGNDREWQTGSLELMTAGKGIIHTEEITTRTQMRILQLWLVLPPEKRWAEPRLQRLEKEDVPVIKNKGSEIRVYSGSSEGVHSPLQNYTPLTLLDVIMDKDSALAQPVPSSYTTFIYVLEGNIRVGNKLINQDQAGWFDSLSESVETMINFHTDKDKARFILYAAQPHNVQVISHGPFIGDTREDIVRLYREYNQGMMPHLNDLPQDRKIKYYNRME